MKLPTPERIAAWRRLSICVVTGFSSGLPLFLLLNLVPAWLRSAQVDLKAIGLLALVQLPYTWKFLWSPLVDRYGPAGFGRRRGWMLATQIGLLGAIAVLGLAPTDLNAPVSGHLAALLAFAFHPVTLLALLVVLCSATQDIALDAYRRELLRDEELGLGNSIHVTAYRVAGLVPGSLSLILADHLAWSQVFLLTALFMLPGLLLTLVVSEPQNTAQAPATLRAAAIEPLREFLERAGWRHAAWVLAFMFFYKLGDSLCTALATPFYLDMGYSMTEIGLVAKNAGLWASIGGGLLGGLWMLRLGIARALWVFGAVQILSILGFVWLASSASHGAQVDAQVLGSVARGLDVVNAISRDLFGGAITASPLDVLRWLKLGVVVGLEAFGVGVGTAAFVAFIAAQTHTAYTATQLALFTSFTAVPRALVNSASGYLVDALGWTHFYWLCFVLAVPGMLMLFKVAPWRRASV